MRRHVKTNGAFANQTHLDDYIVDVDCIHVPLCDRAGQIRAWTLIDTCDIESVWNYRWYLNRAGYACRTDRKETTHNVSLHRQVMGVLNQANVEVDHISRDRLDNRRRNLRICTRATNAQNTGSRGGTSQYRNVCWHKARGKWIVQVRHNGGQVFLGYFVDEREAARAAEAFRAKHLPFAQPDPRLVQL